MSLMDVLNGFRGIGTTQPTTTVDVSGNKTVPDPNAIANGGTQTIGAIPAPGVGDKSPLENYKDLWQIDPNAAKPPTLTPNFNIDNTKILDAAKTLDFTKVLNPELLSKASKGDETALASIINTVGQNAYAQAAALSLNTTKAALEAQETNFRDKVMPDILRRHSISTVIQNDNSQLANNPALAPILSVLERQLTDKYPTASPEEIKLHASTYFSGLAEEVVKATGGTITRKDENMGSQPLGGSRNTDNVDWEKLLTSTP